jgi:hypothetical protein
MPKKYGINEFFYDVCPLKTVKKKYFVFLKMYSFYRRDNVLPYSGGLLDQPSKIVELFYFLNNEIDKHNGR